MVSFLPFLFAATAGLLPVPWTELALSIEEDRGVSSDHVTLCRVRVVNHGRSTWPGRRITFEARALRAGRVQESRAGHFGLTLGPHETLETLIGFEGRYDRFEVSPIERADTAKGGSRRRSKGRSGKKRR
ncbi:MAG: hypothetical protein M3167_05050 [Acidobacteriota bacterium]|nr:hypothetical protein [Acidobacteriota bacterium]